MDAWGDGILGLENWKGKGTGKLSPPLLSVVAGEPSKFY
jgi:hypothetical protein